MLQWSQLHIPVFITILAALFRLSTYRLLFLYTFSNSFLFPYARLGIGYFSGWSIPPSRLTFFCLLSQSDRRQYDSVWPHHLFDVQTLTDQIRAAEIILCMYYVGLAFFVSKHNRLDYFWAFSSRLYKYVIIKHINLRKTIFLCGCSQNSIQS